MRNFCFYTVILFFIFTAFNFVKKNIKQANNFHFFCLMKQIIKIFLKKLEQLEI
jgi:hypothetical protein